MKAVIKKAGILLTSLGFLVGSCVSAQDVKEKKDSKDKVVKQKEIIIRKKGDDKKKYTIVVDGDNVTINGKPISEYKGEDLVIEKRERGDLAPLIIEGMPHGEFFPKGGFQFFSDDKSRVFNYGGNRTVLGVYSKENDKGAEISELSKESAAEAAGLKEGDIITKINSDKVEGPESLSDAIGKYKPDEEVTVTYLRDGKENTTKAKLKKSEHALAYSFKTAPKIRVRPDMNLNIEPFDNKGRMIWGITSRPKLGISIEDTEEGKGVKVLDVDDDSPASKAGLQKDDVIMEIAGTKIENVQDARDAIRENNEKSTVNFKVERAGKPVNVEVKIPKKLNKADL